MCQTCVKWQAGSSSNRVVSAIKPVHRPYSTIRQLFIQATRANIQATRADKVSRQVDRSKSQEKVVSMPPKGM